MTFLSYAQNAEDVLLWRALGDVADGFYVDAGAAEPDDLSVTRAFYDRGWRGIDVEPVPELAAQLRLARPRDLVLPVLLGAEDGEGELTVLPGTGLSTVVEENAAAARERGFASERLRLPRRRLSGILDEAGAGVIHFLKVDVEGAEAEVLAGCDFARHRPWVVLVEATRPNSAEPTHEDWEPILLGAGYRFALFDGLNRFYVAGERAERLLPRLSAPANVLDDYRRVSDLPPALRLEAERHEALLAAERAALAGERAEVARLHRAVEDHRHRADALQAALEAEQAETARLRGAEEEGQRRAEALQSALAEVARLHRAVEDHRLRGDAIQAALEAEQAEAARLRGAEEEGRRRAEALEASLAAERAEGERLRAVCADADSALAAAREAASRPPELSAMLRGGAQRLRGG